MGLDEVPASAKVPVEERLRAYLRTSLPGLEAQVDAMASTDPLRDVIGSLSLLELVDFVEQAFDVDIEPLEFIPENFSSLQRIIDLVRRKTSA
jgi:acyl carrier protein